MGTQEEWSLEEWSLEGALEERTQEDALEERDWLEPAEIQVIWEMTETMEGWTEGLDVGDDE